MPRSRSETGTTAPILAPLSIRSSFQRPRWGWGRVRTGRPEDPPPLRRRQGMLRRARLLDVERDLRDQVGLALEDPRVASAPPGLDDQAAPVEVPLVVEQERLDAQLGAAVVRVHADRRRRPVAV